MEVDVRNARCKFSLFIHVTTQRKLDREIAKEFLETGFLPVDLLENLFEKLTTREQYEYIGKMIAIVCPEKYEGLILFPDQKADKKPSGSEKRPEAARQKKESQADKGAKKKPEKATAEKRPAAIAAKPKNNDALLASLLRRIFDTVCGHFIHPSGAFTKMDLVKNSLESIIPDHKLVINPQADKMRLLNGGGRCVIEIDLPKKIFC